MYRKCYVSIYKYVHLSRMIQCSIKIFIIIETTWTALCVHIQHQGTLDVWKDV